MFYGAVRKVSFLSGSVLNDEIIGASQNVFSINLHLQLKHASSYPPPAGLVAAGGLGPGLVRGAARPRECGGLAAGGLLGARQGPLQHPGTLLQTWRRGGDKVKSSLDIIDIQIYINTLQIL